MTGAALKLNAGTVRKNIVKDKLGRFCCDVVNSVIRFFGQNEREKEVFC